MIVSGVMRDTFNCSICVEKCDSEDEAIYPIDDLANGFDIEENWMCKECEDDLKNEKYSIEDYDYIWGEE